MTTSGAVAGVERRRSFLVRLFVRWDGKVRWWVAVVLYLVVGMGIYVLAVRAGVSEHKAFYVAAIPLFVLLQGAIRKGWLSSWTTHWHDKEMRRPF